MKTLLIMKTCVVGAFTAALLFCASSAHTQAVIKDHDPFALIVPWDENRTDFNWKPSYTIGNVGIYVRIEASASYDLFDITMPGRLYYNPASRGLMLQGIYNPNQGITGMLRSDYGSEFRITPGMTYRGRDYPHTVKNVSARYDLEQPFAPYVLGQHIRALDLYDYTPVINLSLVGIPLIAKGYIEMGQSGALSVDIWGRNIYAEQSTGARTYFYTQSYGYVTEQRTVSPPEGQCSLSFRLVEEIDATVVISRIPTVRMGIVLFGQDFSAPVAVLPDLPIIAPITGLRLEPTPEKIATFCACRFYADADDDGYGNASQAVYACTEPDLHAAVSGDCNDGDPAIHPGALEIATNSADDNCDGQIDETKIYYRDADGDTYGDPQVTAQGASMPAGYVLNDLDCNDAAASAYPGATETLNGRDDDCDGLTDEGEQNTYYRDRDNDGYGDPFDSLVDIVQPAGYVLLGGDCMDEPPPLKPLQFAALIHPGADELCDSADNNCNGEVDEGIGFRFYRDWDGDGYGNPNILLSYYSCEKALPALPPTDPYPGDPDLPPQKEIRFVWNNRDCDDTDLAVNPRRPELCANAKDDNCNGQVDEICHAPVAVEQAVETAEDRPVVISLTATDADGNALSYAVIDGATAGTLSGAAPGLVYTPGENYHGADRFTYQVSDGLYVSNTATVSLTINPVNDRPVADAGPDQTLAVGATCEATATMNGASSADADADPLTYTWSWRDMTAQGASPSITVTDGSHMISLVVNDGTESSLSDVMVITAVDQTPPAITPPADVTAECSGPNGQQVNYGTATVTDNCCLEEVLASGPEVFFPGQATMVWTGKDCNGNTATATQTVTVQDTAPPTLSVSVSPSVLWPPNHTMVEVVPAVSTGDVCCGTNVTVTLLSVRMSEGDVEDTFDPLYDADPATGFIGEDVQIVDGRIYLRAERSGRSDGRTYIITYQAVDCLGNVAVASNTVTVPHDQR